MVGESKETTSAVFVFIVTFGVYLKSLHPSLPGGDSGDLIMAAYETGVAHPPGYPLFTLLAKLFIKVIPVGSVAWRVNLLTAVCGALCASVAFLLIYRLSHSCGASLLGAFTFSLSRLVWMWSVSAEVFALNNFLISTLMLIAVRFDSAGKDSLLKLSLSGSFICGLCLSNQHTSIVYIVVIVPWALYRLLVDQHLTFPVMAKLTAACICGLLPYLYLPVSAHLHVARSTWGDQRSVAGFLTHLLRLEYGTLDLLKGQSGQGIVAGLSAYLNHVFSELSLSIGILTPLSFFSIYNRYKKQQSSVLIVFRLMLVVYLIFFCWRANLDIDNPLFLRVVERFWMQADLVVVILASVTFSDICRFASCMWNFDKFKVEMALVLPLIVHHVTSRQLWKMCDQSDNLVVHDFAVQNLMSFPPDSIVLTKGDLPSTSFRYFHLCESARPDLTVFDQEILTFEWSLPMMRDFYPGIKFPGDLLQMYSGLRADDKRAFRFKDLIDANSNSRPVFACIGVQNHEQSWTESYSLWPFGVCWQFVRHGSVLDVSKWTAATAHLADKWPEPWSSIDDGSWEYIANSEMWRAKVSTAFFYLELAVSMPEGQKESTHLLMESYQLYTNAMEKNTLFPEFWHRNYAIVCDRLMRAGTQLDQLMLLEKTIFHFKAYVDRAPGDADSKKIIQAVAALENYLVSFKMFNHSSASIS